jgi:hypothetical protein
MVQTTRKIIILSGLTLLRLKRGSTNYSRRSTSFELFLRLDLTFRFTTVMYLPSVLKFKRSRSLYFSDSQSKQREFTPTGLIYRFYNWDAVKFTKYLNLLYNPHLSGCCRGKSLDLYSEGDLFECRPEHRLSWLRFFMVLLRPSGQSRDSFPVFSHLYYSV